MKDATKPAGAKGKEEIRAGAAPAGQALPSDKPGKQTDPKEDGRNKEWQDRARVNLEEVPEGTQTNIERDFEAESPGEEKTGKENKNDETVY